MVMEKKYKIQKHPFVVPTTDGKLIEEHFGRVATQQENISIARMIAPSGWSEPHQNPAFDEWTLVSKGKKLIEVDGEVIKFPFLSVVAYSIIVESFTAVNGLVLTAFQTNSSPFDNISLPTKEICIGASSKVE